MEPDHYRIEHPLVVNVVDGSVLVYVPEGWFEMGSDPGNGHPEERPRHSVNLSAYWIGVNVVTNAQYLKFAWTTGHRLPHNQRHKEGGLRDHPVTDVSWDDAAAYAKWAGCELASEAQWEKACRGREYLLRYPWGDLWEDGSRCRNSDNKHSSTTSEVYGYPKGASGYGTYNQSGNVWEWCADWYGERYYESSPKQDPRGPPAGAARVIRGGSWGRNEADYFTATRRHWEEPGGNHYGSLGFRLVRAAS